jgi:hypothetical protein
MEKFEAQISDCLKTIRKWIGEQQLTEVLEGIHSAVTADRNVNADGDNQEGDEFPAKRKT